MYRQEFGFVGHLEKKVNSMSNGTDHSMYSVPSRLEALKV